MMVKTLAIWPLLALAALAWLACEGGEAPPPNSGIEGQVLVGPQCPVVREDTPCPDLPIQATIDVWTAGRTEKVGTFTTDEQGRFRVPLAPGEYLIEPQAPQPGAPPTPLAQTVSVPANTFAQITVQYDSGIR